MSDPKYNFQYCPKIVLFSEDWQKVLLAKRYGEQDYDGVYTFIGGKIEVSDESIVAGIRREKNEEIGESAKVMLYAEISYNLLFRKKDGNSMIVSHYAAYFADGEITLNPDEYSEYMWVPITELETFEPKIKNIPEIVQWGVQARSGGVFGKALLV